jgi:hypothetical protein
MEDPIKVIWKFKNKNKKIQYNVCIFLGNIILEDQKARKILNKIQDLNLFDTLISCSSNEYELMNKYYGEYWYRFFFNAKHITSSINDIKKTNIKKNDIIDKYGEDWYKKHISSFEYINRTYYNYANIIKQEYERKNKHLKNKQIDADSNIDYSIISENKLTNIEQESQEGGAYNLDDSIDMSNYISNINSNSKEFNQNDNIDNEIKLNNILKGGSKDDDDEEEEEKEEDDEKEEDEEEETDEEIEGEEGEEEEGGEEKQTDEREESDEEQQDEEYDISYEGDEISNVALLNMDADVDQTTKSLNNIIEKDDLSKFKKIVDFDDKKNNIMYDSNLKDIYSKTYVYNQYIFKDDTIQAIKNKISCGITQNSLFGKNVPYITPSRMYLWSEYDYIDEKMENKNLAVMLGQKWMKRNELLKIKIEPFDNLRVYERLSGDLKNLKESILKYGSRIRKEIDDTNVLDEYINYITNNEIYMLDIYHELGNGYEANDEIIKNIFNVYVRIYYNISQDELKQIIDCLNGESKIETNKIIQVYKNLDNDLRMENEVANRVELLKLEPEKYNNIFKENFVIQTVIHITLQHVNVIKSAKINLFKIFDNFIIDDNYPFLQFQSTDNKLIYKFYTHTTETDKTAVLSKWFENSPYGISFKVKINQRGDSSNKYISVNLNENGQLEYKTQWKEDDKATIDDIKNTYSYIRNLLNKINSENDKLQIIIPTDESFRYAFINTTQQIELPEKYAINHNDLSDFARYFFPYVAVVIEPRKRESKIKNADNKSKFGTYLRYKRLSKYESEARIEHRIIYFLRNYEYIEKLLSAEISKQFNITEKQALEKIQDVKTKFPNLKKSRKFLKKLLWISFFKSIFNR